MTEGPQGPGQGQERYADDAHRYRLDSRIATGGMGEVWRGTDTSLGRPVAVKLLKHEYADDPSFRSRFTTEARHAAALHHPGVASVYDFGEAVDAGSATAEMPRPFLVMELVDGQPLSALLRDGRRLDPAATQDLLAQAADAIGAAHAAGIVHRDVKPANLLVTPDRRIKITDFGIARATDGLGLTGTGQVMGTPQYLSPEQARGETATPASDVYSLGVVAFECLAGRRPFDADSPVATALAHLNDPVPALPADVPPALAGVVTRALSKDPAARYADGAAFAAALRDPSGAEATAFVPLPAPPLDDGTQVLTGVPPVVPPPTESTVAVTEDRRSPWPVVLLVIALIVVAVIIVLLLVNNSEDEPDPEPSDTPSTTTSSDTSSPSESQSSSEPSETEPETFSINPGDYVGRDVDEVAADLRALGLSVDTSPVENPGDEEAGTVESVSPTEGLAEGDTVTVGYWGDPPPPEPTEPTEPTPSDSGTTGGTTPSDPTQLSASAAPSESGAAPNPTSSEAAVNHREGRR